MRELAAPSLCGLLLAVACGCSYDFDAYTPGAAAADAATPSDAAGDTTTPGDAPAGCTEPGAKSALGRCYFPTSSVLDWNAARKACESAGAHLLTITSVDEQLAISAVGTGERWIGLSRPDGSPNAAASFVWITGEAVTFARWGGGKPTGAGACVYLDADAVWRDRPCGDALSAICERGG